MSGRPTRRGWLKGLVAALGGWVAGRATPPAARSPAPTGPVTQIMVSAVSCRTVQTAAGTVTICCLDGCGQPVAGLPTARDYDSCGGIIAITDDDPPPNHLSPG